MALTKGRVLVEYIGGDEKEALAVPGITSGVKLEFRANPAYDNRRIEVFASENEAVQWMGRWNRRFPLFQLATDLIVEEDRVVVEKMIEGKIDALLQPLRDRVEHLEALVASLQKPQAPKGKARGRQKEAAG